MKIRHIMIFPGEDQFMNDAKTWVDNPLLRDHNNIEVVALRNGKTSPAVRVVALTTTAFYRNYIKVKRAIAAEDTACHRPSREIKLQKNRLLKEVELA